MMIDMGELYLARFSRLKFITLQWNTLPHTELALNVALLSRAIQRLVTPLSTHTTLDQMEIRFCLTLSHAIVGGLPCILQDLDRALVALHICYPAMALRLHFPFHVFVASGVRGRTPDILSLIKPVVKRAVASGLQLKVTTLTTVFLPGTVVSETITIETNFGSL